MQTAQKHQTDFFPEFKDIKSGLGNITTVVEFDINPKFSFSVTFAQLFMCDLPNYSLTKGLYGATRSNWTYHTAITISQTCKVLDLTCRFEANGRRDAVIETREETAQDFLFAEWEWDYQDIFGTGKELEKLSKSCRASKTADAFLLTYCPKREYVDFLQSISTYWIKSVSRIKIPPTLFLHTVICEEKGGARTFERLRTVEIHPSWINVWTDKYF
jgi:hypothetical protein